MDCGRSRFRNRVDSRICHTNRYGFARNFERYAGSELVGAPSVSSPFARRRCIIACPSNGALSNAWRRPHPSANSDQNRHVAALLLLIIFLGRHARCYCIGYWPRRFLIPSPRQLRPGECSVSRPRASNQPSGIAGCGSAARHNHPNGLFVAPAMKPGWGGAIAMNPPWQLGPGQVTRFVAITSGIAEVRVRATHLKTL